MSGKAKIAIAAAALVVVAVSTAGVLAQGADTVARHDGKSSPARTRTTVPLTVTKSGGPVAAATPHGVALAFDETNKVTVPPGRSQIKVGPTQKGCRTINGYYFVPGLQHTKVSSEGDSPAGHRFWKFYRSNRTGKPIKGVVYGEVCIGGARLIP